MNKNNQGATQENDPSVKNRGIKTIQAVDLISEIDLLMEKTVFQNGIASLEKVPFMENNKTGRPGNPYLQKYYVKGSNL